MASLSQSRSIAIKPHLNMSVIDHYINYGTGAAIWPQKGFVEQTYQSLLGIGPHAQVWRREHIPAEFHYRSNRRIPPILIMPQDRWFLVNNTNDPVYMNGSHGYNNSLMDMHPFFIARGPAFRKSYISEPFSSVDIYGLICEISGLKPAPNNGSLDAVKPILAKPCLAQIIGIGTGAFIALAVLVSIMYYSSKGATKTKVPDSKHKQGLPLLGPDYDV